MLNLSLKKISAFQIKANTLEQLAPAIRILRDRQNKAKIKVTVNRGKIFTTLIRAVIDMTWTRIIGSENKALL